MVLWVNQRWWEQAGPNTRQEAMRVAEGKGELEAQGDREGDRDLVDWGR